MISIKQLKEQFVISELENRLKADKKGVLRDQIVHELSACADEMQQQKQSGLAPHEYSKSEKMLAGLRVAEQVVCRTWNNLHASQTG